MRRHCLTLFILLVATVTQAQTAGTAKNHHLEVAKILDIFNQVYKNLDLLYVDTLNPDQVVSTGIKAMLQSLDPYTEYYPESGTLLLIRCPKCGRENWAPQVASGTCAWCGYDGHELLNGE